MSYRNLVELFEKQSEKLGPRVALRYKCLGLYRDVTWERYYQDALACAASLIDVGIRPGDRVGLLSENRLEWLVADMGIMMAGAVNVPPHAPLTARQIHYQLKDAGVSWSFVSTPAQMEKIQAVRGELPDLRGVVGFEGRYSQKDHISWRAFLQRGRDLVGRVATHPSTKTATHATQELRRRERALNEDSLATIMYTSGTTGNPKGVMLTHGNLLSNACAVNEASRRQHDAVLLNWLPFSHIYARTVDHYLSIVAGVTLCLAVSAETIIENLAEVQPTHMSSVPRFYEKVLTAAAESDPAKQASRLKAIFGPRVEWLSSGGAPLPPSIARIFYDSGILLLQGYGLTESGPVISFNSPEEFKLETVGKPIPGVQVRIAGDGEILTYGPHVMPGYWNNPKATQEAIRDGWLHTGDLGQLDDDGFLSITGRKKELLVLSNGKKVVPPYLEGLLLSDPCIDQAVVCGEGKNFLTALVVPHWDNLRQALKAAGTNATDAPESLAADNRVNAFLQQRIDGLLGDVSNAEKVRRILVLAKPFSLEADELTVSLKMRRNVIFEKYKGQLETLYSAESVQPNSTAAVRSEM